MQILYLGAEARISKEDFDGQEAVVKERIKKGYRIEKIDNELRKIRTRKEVKLLTEARRIGVLTPKILNVDEKNYRIVMEYVKGERLKEVLDSASKYEIEEVSEKIGKIIGRLHSANIVHGDLTTSNMILKDNEIYLIDFSLGEFTQRIENKGVDLKLLKEALTSTHLKNFHEIWGSVIKGYRDENKDARKIIEQLGKIEKRARYVTR